MCSPAMLDNAKLLLLLGIAFLVSFVGPHYLASQTGHCIGTVDAAAPPTVSKVRAVTLTANSDLAAAQCPSTATTTTASSTLGLPQGAAAIPSLTPLTWVAIFGKRPTLSRVVCYEASAGKLEAPVKDLMSANATISTIQVPQTSTRAPAFVGAARSMYP